MRGLAGRGESHAVTAACRRSEPQIGGLAVDQESRFRADTIRGFRTVAAPLFAADEHQADARFTFGPQPLRRRELRGENALRIARTAAVQLAVFDAAWEERRHAVKVGGEDNIGFADRGNHIDSGAIKWLL